MESLCKVLADDITTNTVRSIRDGDNALRKQILLLSRFMSVKPTGNLYFQTQHAIRYLVYHYIQSRPRPPDFMGDYETFALDSLEAQFNDPLRAGIFIMACCISPLGQEDIEAGKLSSWLKEIRVMERDAYDPHLNWNVFFGDHHAALHPIISPNPYMAKVVHAAIDEWILDITHPYKEFIPTLSLKLLPSFTRREMDLYVKYRMTGAEEFTQADMEWLHHRVGVQFDGGCEMSQRWYSNGISPRTYYVAGADAFNRSRFLKKIWQSLADHLVVTHRHNRVNPVRIHVPEDRSCLFYDLTSFTSNLGVQRSFLEALATYCAGKTVTLSDLGGQRVVCLESLIREYNTLNIFGEYRDGRVWDSLTDPRHGVAGFLGVTGNIVTCSFIHGAVLLQMVDETNHCGCAGDDAVVVTKDKEHLWFCIPLIGILALEKTYDLDDGPAVYLKRRTEYSKLRPGIQSRRYVQLPSLLYQMAKEDKTQLRRFREFFDDNQTLRNRAAGSLLATFRSCSGVPKQHLVEVEKVLTWYYERHGFPCAGQVPQFLSSNLVMPFVPSLSAIGSPDFVRETIEWKFPGYAWLPPVISEEFGWAPLQKGTVISTVSSERARYLAKIGVLEELPSQEVLLYGDEALSGLIRLYTERVDRHIRYRVLEDAPFAFGDGQVLGNVVYDDLPVDSWIEDVPIVNNVEAYSAGNESSDASSVLDLEL